MLLQEVSVQSVHLQYPSFSRPAKLTVDGLRIALQHNKMPKVNLIYT